ncbi:hypothetical protein F5Y03DRAFT_391904 [Xylaria venustula]|nr:hypothetical protein F5Y03DRAFT_391904 [Xylaria venustula]
MQKGSVSLRLHGSSNQGPDQVVDPALLNVSHMNSHHEAQGQLDPHHEDHSHVDYIHSQNNQESKSREEHHEFSTGAHSSTPLMSKETERPHMTPEIRIDPPKREQQDASVSVSKRRGLFENMQHHSHKVVSESENKHLRSDTQFSQEEKSVTPISLHLSPLQHNTFTSTTHKSEQEEVRHDETGSFNEQHSEPEIAKPTPIAPPNHECSWKERYLDLTAEIRQLKAELSTRASLKGSDLLGSAYAQHEDDLDLLEVTIILHFRDRDDIVINTDVVRDAEPRG